MLVSQIRYEKGIIGLAGHKKTRRIFDGFDLCPGGDLNPHTNTGTSTSSLRVYQFHHLDSGNTRKIGMGTGSSNFLFLIDRDFYSKTVPQRVFVMNQIDPLIEHAIHRPGELMISISGIRGTIPDGLDPVNITLFARAFGAITGKRIVIGEDSRITGPILKHLLIGTLLAAGKEVLDIGLAPTPTVKAAVKSWKADAGVVISASHNPPNWNAFKFIDREGFFFNAARGKELLDAMRSGTFPAKGYKEMGTLEIRSGVESHIESVLSVIPNLKQIQKMKYRVVVDGVGGAGRDALPMLLKKMGCKVERLFCDPVPSGEFPRPPEPTPDALKKFSKFIKKTGSHVGFALDPDADRLVVGSPKTGAINEEYTVPLSFLGLLKADTIKGLARGKSDLKDPGLKKTRPVVVNLSTSRLIDGICSKVGVPVERSAVGEANVVEKMLGAKAAFGGEGNGGVIHPKVPSFGRDSLTGAALILSAMASLGAKTIDELMQLFPPLYMEKIKLPLAPGQSADGMIASVEATFPGGLQNREDGLHLLFSDGSWIHVRASNTEPIVRVIAEAPSREGLGAILEKITSLA